MSSQLKLKIPGNRRNNWEQGNLSRFYFEGSIIRTAGLIEVNKIRVHPAINIVDAEYPVVAELTSGLYRWCKSYSKIQTMIWWHPILINFTVFLRQYSIDDIKSFGQSCGITGTINKYRREFPSFVRLIHTDQTQIVTTIILCRKLFTTIEIRKFSPCPGQGITDPTGKFSPCLINKKFSSITPTSSKYKLLFRIF